MSASSLHALLELKWPAYILAFGGSFAVAWLITPMLVRYALRRGHPASTESSPHSPVPYLGGLAIVASFSTLCASAAVVAGSRQVIVEVGFLLLLGLGLAVTGLVDDLRGGISPLLRVAIEATVAFGVFFVGSGVAIPSLPHWLNLALTVLWVVGITNAINLLDNMDGLSAGIATVASLTFALIAALNGQYLVAALAAGVAGCAAGFLRHNFFPAKIYMGDAGSLFLGFLLAVLGLKLQLTTTPQLIAVFVPILVLGLPIFDTTLVVWQRLRHGRSPFMGGRDHASHRLVWIGIPVPAAVTLLYAAALSLSWLSVTLLTLDTSSAILLMSFIATVGVTLMALLAAVPVYANSKQRRTMLRLVEAYEPEPQSPSLTARGA